MELESSTYKVNLSSISISDAIGIIQINKLISLIYFEQLEYFE